MRRKDWWALAFLYNPIPEHNFTRVEIFLTRLPLLRVEQCNCVENNLSFSENNNYRRTKWQVTSNFLLKAKEETQKPFEQWKLLLCVIKAPGEGHQSPYH